MGDKRSAKGKGGYRRRKDGKWDVYCCGRHTTVKTEADAKRKLQEMRQEIQQAKANGNIKTNKKMTVNSYIEHWLETYKKGELKPTAYATLEHTFKNRIMPTIGDMQIQALKTDDIQYLINELNKTYSQSTIRKVYYLLNECFKEGIIKQELTYNPCLGVVLPKGRRTAVNDDNFYYKPEQIKEIIQIAKSKDSNGNYHYRYGNAIVLLFYTGMREGELLGLKWKDINLKNKMIHVHGNVVTIKDNDGKWKPFEQDTPKTSRPANKSQAPKG